MNTLKIEGTDYKAQAGFKFIEVADAKYPEKNKDGQVVQDGVRVIYAGLLDFDPIALVKFWDCALAHHDKNPSKNQIETALFEAAGEKQDFDPLVKQAFQVIDNAGFFKNRVKKFWKETELMKDFAENERQEKAMAEQTKTLKEARKLLNSGTSKK